MHLVKEIKNINSLKRNVNLLRPVIRHVRQSQPNSNQLKLNCDGTSKSSISIVDANVFFEILLKIELEGILEKLVIVILLMFRCGQCCMDWSQLGKRILQIQWPRVVTPKSLYICSVENKWMTTIFQPQFVES